MEPTFMEGQIAVDDRGQLTFCNAFEFKGVRRFYMVENFSTDVVRAWHGHLKESKSLLIVSGAAVVAAVQLDAARKPSQSHPVYRFVLSAGKPGLLHIPAGYANGFRFLEAGTRLMILSSSSVEESKEDDFRVPFDYLGDAIWRTENR
jgi:dTDP-4-dehydrorhamnose 3,5-epimerase-like enzyme